MIKRTLITISLATTILCSTQAHAFMNGGDSDFSFGNSLIDAVDQNNTDLIRASLEQGNDPNQPGKFETTALQRAAFNGNVEIANMLIASGADVNVVDHGGASPLHIAAREGKDDIAKDLLAKGANINAQDDQGYTPLHRAIVNSRISVTSYLISAGADVNTVNNEGNSPLIDAVRISNADVVKQLLLRGADKSVKNNRGMDVVDYALKSGNSGIDSLLGKSSQQLMQENPGTNVSQTNVVVTNTNPASNIPASLREATPYTNATQAQTSGFSTNAVKVPVASVAVENISAPNGAQVAEKPFVRTAQTIKPASQLIPAPRIGGQRVQPVAPQEVQADNNIKPFELTDLQMTGEQNNPANLQRAPRLPKEGNLPGSLQKDYAETKKRGVEQIKQAQEAQLQNIKPIELPKDAAQIENTSNNSIKIAEAAPAAQQPLIKADYKIDDSVRADLIDRPANTAPVKIAPVKAQAELVRAPRIKVETINTQNNIPASLKDENKYTAPAVIQAESMQTLPAQQNAFVQNIFTPAPTPAPTATPQTHVKGLPANTYLVTDTPAQIPPAQAPISQAPVAQISIDRTSAQQPVQQIATLVAAPALIPAPRIPTPQAVVNAPAQTAPTPVAAAPTDAAYEAQVDNLMSAYAETVDVNKEYETEVDTLMDTLINNDAVPTPTIMKPQLSAEAAPQPAGQNTPAYPLSLTLKAAMNKNIPLNAAPAQSESSVIFNQQLAPKAYVPQPIYTAPAVTPAASTNPVSGDDYNSYRSNLLSNVNDFYNNDVVKYQAYDISDLEKKRQENLGTNPDAHVNGLPAEGTPEAMPVEIQPDTTGYSTNPLNDK